MFSHSVLACCRFLDSGGVYKLAFGPKAFIVVSDPVVVRHLLKVHPCIIQTTHTCLPPATVYRFSFATGGLTAPAVPGSGVSLADKERKEKLPPLGVIRRHAYPEAAQGSGQIGIRHQLLQPHCCRAITTCTILCFCCRRRTPSTMTKACWPRFWSPSWGRG